MRWIWIVSASTDDTLSQVSEISLDHQAVSHWTLSFHTSHGGACPISRQPQTFKVTWGGSRVRLCRRRTRVNPKLQWKACGLLTWKRSACLEKLGRIGNGLQFKIFSVFPQSSIIPTVASNLFFFAIFWDKWCMWKILDNHSRNSHEKTNLHPSS